MVTWSLLVSNAETFLPLFAEIKITCQCKDVISIISYMIRLEIKVTAIWFQNINECEM
jgi:hypothetical protein